MTAFDCIYYFLLGRVLVKKRKVSVKIRAVGLFPGATVQRGKDWQWGDQDGK
jgi:hypothetical protein